MQDFQQILVVEDDKRLARMIREYLQEQGYKVDVERRGDLAGQRILQEQPALVVLDLTLPGKDGLTILKQTRKDFKGPVLILTAREDDTDQVVGLELGADDYVKKPVEPRVLLARIRALLRRVPKSTVTGPPDEHHDTIDFGKLSIHLTSRRITLDQNTIDLTSSEFDLLWLIAQNAGTVLDRDTIYKVLRGIEYDGLDRSVDVIIYRLRKKLGDDSSTPKRIKTIWGKGYLFVKDAW